MCPNKCEKVVNGCKHVVIAECEWVNVCEAANVCVNGCKKHLVISEWIWVNACELVNIYECSPVVV